VCSGSQPKHSISTHNQQTSEQEIFFLLDFLM